MISFKIYVSRKGVKGIKGMPKLNLIYSRTNHFKKSDRFEILFLPESKMKEHKWIMWEIYQTFDRVVLKREIVDFEETYQLVENEKYSDQS